MQRNERFSKRERRRKWEERRAMKLPMEGYPEPEPLSDSEDELGKVFHPVTLPLGHRD